MNTAYKILQRFAFEMCLFFGTAPYAPSFLQKNYGGTVAATYTWTLTAISIVVFLLCLLWLKSEWVVLKPAYMIAITFGSVLGGMIGISALIGLYGFGTHFYLWWRDVPALILGVFMFGGVVVQLLMPKYND